MTDGLPERPELIASSPPSEGERPVFPGKPAMAARRIDTQEDVDEVIELMRIHYERIVARYGLPAEETVNPAA